LTFFFVFIGKNTNKMGKFKVKKGKKFFWGPRWNFLMKNRGEFTVRAYFWGDCLYRLQKNYDQVNKLTGQSFNFIPFYDKKSKSWKKGHHKNSVRFGWRCVDGEEIEIMAYAYVDKVRRQKKMLSIKIDTCVHLNFKETNDYYTFKAIAENGDASVARFKKSSTKKGFLGLFIHRLYPYFGGRIASPHKMTIDLEYLKKFV